MLNRFLAIALITTLLPVSVFGLEVGDVAPNFTLQATDGKTYTLGDFKGQKAVVIAWFPKAYTRGCTIECKSLANIVNGLFSSDKISMIHVSSPPCAQQNPTT